jgi:hypothetical protein
MPCIWGQHNGFQLFFPVVILPPDDGALPKTEHVAVQALVDTGATTTGITGEHAARLQMQPVGIVQIHGVGGIQQHNSHLFRVGFPFTLPTGIQLPPDHQPPAPGQMLGQIFILQKVIQGCAFQGASAPFQVLLGMARSASALKWFIPLF